MKMNENPIETEVCVQTFHWHCTVKPLPTVTIPLWSSGSIPACRSPSTASASSAISLHPTSSCSQYRARSATFFSWYAAQCDPPCHEASLPPACSSGSRSDILSLLAAFSYLLGFQISEIPANYNCTLQVFIGVCMTIFFYCDI